jgi:hypothetical protein
VVRVLTCEFRSPHLAVKEAKGGLRNGALFVLTCESVDGGDLSPVRTWSVICFDLRKCGRGRSIPRPHLERYLF